MTAKKTMIFHVGGAKTGSSALQVFFEVNKLNLKKNNISYANSPQISSYKEITSGNGELLYQKIKNSKTTEKDIENIFNSYFEGTTFALCSSEHLSSLGEREWSLISHICTKMNIVPKIIMYVRDVAPFYWSAYNQVVKRHGTYKPFEETLQKKDNYCYHAQSLRILVSVFGNKNIKVVHYDSSKNRLAKTFMDMIDIPCQEFVDVPLDTRVNRSLTEHEINILIKLNSVVGEYLCMELSDNMIYRRPNIKYGMRLNYNVVELLRNRHKDDVKWINYTFFDGEHKLAVLGKDPVENFVQRIFEFENDYYEALNEEVIAWSFEKLRSFQEEIINSIIKKVNELIVLSDTSKNCGLPKDFDPFYYLICNQDVLFSGVNPYDHFLLYGRAEGRKWTWKE